ncbi:MAG: WD40 repeat domain-containing protein [Candidatus Poribacteria bacterium]|nr:WD40 repeat domain-containing protein [Candidatus Poribacteria bacterium]
MQSRKPAPFDVVLGDSEGTTWALPEGAIARLGKGIVSSGPGPKLALPPGGVYFAVQTRIGLWWYEMSSKSPIALWETERGLIASADFSPDGEWIAIANWDGILKVMDVQSGECIAQIKRMEEHNIYARVVFSPDHKWIATANQDGNVEVLDIHRGVCVARMDRGERDTQSNDVSHLEFSPDSKCLAATASNPKVYSFRDGERKLINPNTEGIQTYVWHPETGEAIAKFAGRNFIFSPDSRLIACACPDETLSKTEAADSIYNFISVWEIATGKRFAYLTEHSKWGHRIVFSPCGLFLASSASIGEDGEEKILRVWELRKGVQKMIYTDSGKSSKELFYSSEGVLLAAVDREDTIEIWNMELREKLYTLELHPKSIDARWFKKFPQLAIADKKAKKAGNIHTSSTLREFACYPDPIMFLPDGATLATKGYRMGVVLWDVERKQAQKTLLEDKRITSFTVLPCGNMLAATVQNEENVKVWDAEKPDEPIAEFTEQSHLVWRMAFAPTGDQIAVGSREGVIYLYDLKRNEKLKVFTGHTDFIWSVSFSPDGKRLVSSSSDETSKLWDVESSEQIGTFPLDEPRTLMGVAFSPCGSVIATGMFGGLRLWCAETLATLLEIPQPQAQKPYALTFSLCGKYLASGTWWRRDERMEKMAIQLWDVATGEKITTFWGHPTDVQSLAFSPDNTLLASGSHDCTILLWDLKPFIDV